MGAGAWKRVARIWSVPGVLSDVEALGVSRARRCCVWAECPLLAGMTLLFRADRDPDGRKESWMTRKLPAYRTDFAMEVAHALAQSP